jgi:hypothetical protein
MAHDDWHEEFTCPTCQAHYKIVRVKAESGREYRSVHCRVCARTPGNALVVAGARPAVCGRLAR